MEAVCDLLGAYVFRRSCCLILLQINNRGLKIQFSRAGTRVVQMKRRRVEKNVTSAHVGFTPYESINE